MFFFLTNFYLLRVETQIKESDQSDLEGEKAEGCHSEAD